jgi:hypothetical protein
VRIKSVLTIFVILVIVVAGVLILSKKTKKDSLKVPVSTPNIEQKIENKFKGLVIPADAERTELKDVSGGNSMGIATRSEILADLPDLVSGQVYQAFLEKDGKTISLGSLEMAKGGWILDYDSTKFPGYNIIIITLGNIHILEGSF